mgnify:CR=1 FL=1
MTIKQILDVCCGCKMMWFDKNDNRVIFADKRKGQLDTSNCSKNPGKKIICPDVIHDFRNMDFKNESFWHIVFDPPHVKNISLNSVTGFSYGSLDKETWKDDISKGFAECFRVLKTNGTLIFKWNEIQIPLKEVLSLTKYKPLYGHRSGKSAKTHWVAFVKT